MQSEHTELTKAHDKLSEEKNLIAEQLQAEIELCQEAEEARNRLQTRKQELEDIIADFGVKAQEEEEKAVKMVEEKKKLQGSIQDLEERLVLIFIIFVSSKGPYLDLTVTMEYLEIIFIQLYCHV